MQFRFSQEKNQLLIQERGIHFEQIILAIENGYLKKIITHSHPKYSHQYILHIELDGYMYEVPCVQENEDTYFLKTAFPSRKLQKFYFP